jgi:uncharacterized protein with HEPN domain
MTDDISDRLQHIYDAITKIAKYAKRGRRRFDREESTQNSIIYPFPRPKAPVLEPWG